MAGNGPIKTFETYVNQGRINRAMLHAVECWETLSNQDRDDCLKRLHACLQCGVYLGHETRSSIRALVPEFLLSAHCINDLLTSPPSPPEFPPGRTYCLCAVTEGHIHYLQIFESTPDEARRAVLDPIGRTLFRAIEKVYGRMFIWNPLQYDFRIEDCRRKEVPVEGRSLELSLALALCSQVIGQPVPKDIAASATVGHHGHLGKVEGLVEKLSAIAIEKDYVTTVYVAAGQHMSESSSLNQVPAATLEEVLSHIWPRIEAPDLGATIDVKREMDELVGLYDRKNTTACHENATRLIKYLGSVRGRDNTPNHYRQWALFTCYWRRGSSHSHMGHPESALKDLQRAKSIHESRQGVIAAKELQGLCITLGNCLRDLFRYEEAEEQFREVDRHFAGENFNRLGKGKNLSALSQLLTAMGRFSEAVELQQQAIELVDDRNRPRNLYNLAQLYTTWGRYKQSENALKRSRALHAGQSPAVRDESCLPFMDWYEAELHYRWAASLTGTGNRKRHWAIVERISRDYTYPSAEPYVEQFVRRFLGLVCLQQGRETEGLDLLEQVIGFFDTRSKPMMKVLGVLVRAERALYLMDSGDEKGVFRDLTSIAHKLSRQKQFGEYFREEIAKAGDILSRVGGNVSDRGTTEEVLTAVIRKIPY